MNVWRDGTGKPRPNKVWNRATYYQYEPWERACYSWLYEPTATEGEIDQYGMAMLRSLVAEGYETEARELMRDRLSDHHLLEHLEIKDNNFDPIDTVKSSPSNPYAPDIAEAARRAITDGDFKYANELLSTLITALIMQLIQTSRSAPALAGAGVKTNDPPSETAVDEARSELDRAGKELRAVLALYPRAIQHYRAAGKLAEVHRAREGWDELQGRIVAFTTKFDRKFLDRAGFADPQVRIVDAIFVNEESYHRGHHRKWTLAGMDADSSSAPVTPFNDRFEDYGAVTYETSVTRGLETLVGQQNMLLDLYDIPTVRAQFPDGLPTMQDREQRIAVWTAVYEHFKASSGGDAERMTLYFIHRYLKLFTRHSQFNISDFGESFVKRGYPVSLFGRVMQDCGVYAMSVASELYAALEANGVTGYEFIIYFVPSHVTMVLLAGDRFYAINNDEISGPHDVDGLQQAQTDAGADASEEGMSPKEQEKRRQAARDKAMYRQVAKLNARMDGLEWWGSPMTGVSLGESGSMSAKDFDEQAWKEYQKAAHYTLDHQSSPGKIREKIKDVDVQLKNLPAHLAALGGDKQKEIEFLLTNADTLAALFNTIDLLTLSTELFYLKKEYYTGRAKATTQNFKKFLAPHLSEVMGAAGASGMWVHEGSSLLEVMRLVALHAGDLPKRAAAKPLWLLAARGLDQKEQPVIDAYWQSLGQKVDLIISLVGALNQTFELI